MTQDASNDPVRTRAFSDTYAQNDMENKHIAKAGYALVNVCTCIMYVQYHPTKSHSS